MPTLNVRDQWKKQARELFKLQLLTSEFAGHLNDDEFDGVVITYQTLVAQPVLYQRLCNKHPIMVVCDEIHHASTVSMWGTCLGSALETAVKRLSLTGTPFRSDNEKIPFLTIGEDGSYRCDEVYDYPAALRDGVVHNVVFHRFAGSEVRTGDRIRELHTSDDLSEDDESRRLRWLLWSKDYAISFLRQAHEQLMRCRETVPDAGGLIVCIDTNHAIQIAKWLERNWATQARYRCI